MTEPQIVDRGDGPKIAGIRITVYTVLEYLRAGRTRDWIAALLNLSSHQIQVAMDYIHAHSDSVDAEYEHILARILPRHERTAERQPRITRITQIVEEVLQLPYRLFDFLLLLPSATSVSSVVDDLCCQGNTYG